MLFPTGSFFFLGQIAGYPVQEQLQSMEQLRLWRHRLEIDDFDHTAHALAISAGMSNLVSYFKERYVSDVEEFRSAYHF
jgi:hypothetical protein